MISYLYDTITYFPMMFSHWHLVWCVCLRPVYLIIYHTSYRYTMYRQNKKMRKQDNLIKLKGMTWWCGDHWCVYVPSSKIQRCVHNCMQHAAAPPAPPAQYGDPFEEARGQTWFIIHSSTYFCETSSRFDAICTYNMSNDAYIYKI